MSLYDQRKTKILTLTLYLWPEAQQCDLIITRFLPELYSLTSSFIPSLIHIPSSPAHYTEFHKFPTPSPTLHYPKPLALGSQFPPQVQKHNAAWGQIEWLSAFKASDCVGYVKILYKKVSRVMLCRQRDRKECQEQVWAKREMPLSPGHTLQEQRIASPGRIKTPWKKVKIHDLDSGSQA